METSVKCVEHSILDGKLKHFKNECQLKKFRGKIKKILLKIFRGKRMLGL